MEKNAASPPVMPTCSGTEITTQKTGLSALKRDASEEFNVLSGQSAVKLKLDFCFSTLDAIEDAKEGRIDNRKSNIFLVATCPANDK